MRDAKAMQDEIEAGGRSLSQIAEIGGINYSNGNDLSLRMYRIAP